jgi:Holliday junction DNA helicase RuvB
MQPEQRVISANETQQDLDITLRPKLLGDFVGQSQLVKNLDIFIQAARAREEALDHVLFYGPPGLGKTTLSQIIAHELGVHFKVTSGPMLSKVGDLAAILTNLQANDVLFIDEIHRLPAAVEEVLYTAMEDYSIDVIIGDGPAARTVKIDLPRFTLVGATTRLGLLSNPLRDRFGIPLKLEFYTEAELKQVIIRGSGILGVDIEEEAAAKLAGCSRGTPRIAIRILRRSRDFAQYGAHSSISLPVIMETLECLGVDKIGLDSFDYKYMQYIAENYSGGPVGIETIAAGLSEDKNTIEDTIEPFLMQIGFVARTPRGRQLTEKCLRHMGFTIQLQDNRIQDLFSER